MSDDDGFEEAKFEINIKKPVHIDEETISIQLPQPKSILLLPIQQPLQLECKYKQQVYNLIYKRYPQNTNNGTHFNVNLQTLRLFHQNTQVKFINRKSSKLTMDADFPSGNIYQVHQYRQDYIYEMTIQNDTNTKGYNQWFHFRISNMPTHKVVAIRIVNFIKAHSHFLRGMKPILTSGKKRRYLESSDAFIEKLEYKKSDVVSEKSLYTLSFTLRLSKRVKSLFVSMNFPYTYQTLQEFLKTVCVPVLSLCTTLLNYSAPYLEITDCKNPKQVIIAIARQHPGETVSSLVMQGFLRFLLSQSEEAVWLRSQFLFIVVPMVNIDGVQVGNFRCDVHGYDLNRVWNKTYECKHPTVFEAKRLITKHKSRIRFFMDLHGHSKKVNTFLYGCRLEGHAAKCRVYARLMEMLCPFFSFEDCIFKINKGKLATARAAVFNRVKDNAVVPNVFTLETSFFGHGSNVQFTLADLERIGADLLRAMFIYLEGSKEVPLEQYRAISLTAIEGELENRLDEFERADRQQENDSDSEAEKDLLVDENSEDLLQDDWQKEEELVVRTAKEKEKATEAKRKQSLLVDKDALLVRRRQSQRNNIIFPKKIELYEIHRPKGAVQQYPKTPTYSRNAMRAQRGISNFRDDASYPNKSYQMNAVKQEETKESKESKESKGSKESKEYETYQEQESIQQQHPNQRHYQQRLVNQPEKSFKIISTKKREVRKGEVLSLAKNEVGWQSQKSPQDNVSPHFQNETNKQQTVSPQKRGETHGSKQKKQTKKANEKDDVFLSQLLRGVWAMNQQKYGNHVGHNLKFKIYQQYDDARIFNDSQ